MPTRKRRAHLLGIPISELQDKRGKHSNHRKGSHHPKWNERIRSSHGYMKIRVGIKHPLADPNGYAYEHFLVWVSAGNLKPEEDETLHHRSGDKADNRLSNLMVISKGEHSRIHNAHRRRDSLGRFTD